MVKELQYHTQLSNIRGKTVHLIFILSKHTVHHSPGIAVSHPQGKVQQVAQDFSATSPKNLT